MDDNFAYLLPFFMLTFGVVFLFLQKLGNVSSRYWGIGYLCAATGFAAPLLMTGLPFQMQAVLSNVLFFSAFFFYGHALLVHFNRPTLLVPRLCLAVVALVAASFHTILAPDLKRELVIADLSLALLLAMPVWAVRKSPVAPADKAMVAATFFVIVETVTRVVMLIVMTPAGTMTELDEFFASDYAYYMQVAASIFGFLMALSVLASQISAVLRGHVHAAEHDPLTDVLNRRGFDRLVPAFDVGTPEGAVVTCDIDHFKQINDQFGHAAGDIVLIGVAALLRRHTPEQARVARFGGEEFVIFLPGHTAAEAGALANRMRHDLAGMDWRGQGITRFITASFGVSVVARGDHSIHDTIKRADESLYAAKRGGRNQVVLEGARLPTTDGQPCKVISIV